MQSNKIQTLNRCWNSALFTGLVAVVLLICSPPAVQAHTSSISVDSEKAIVMHVEPSHYPVAGKENKIIFFYDKTKWDASAGNSAATLHMTDPSGNITVSDAHFVDGSITTQQKFSEDGWYDMELIVTRNDSGATDRFRFSVGTIQETEQQKDRRQARNVQIVGAASLAGLSLGLLLYYLLQTRKVRTDKK